VVKSGLYNSASEYVRDLVRRDYERVELRKLDPSRSEIESEVEAALAEFDSSRESGKSARESKPRRKLNGR
jgi:antitoxin ParD1/3/4